MGDDFDVKVSRKGTSGTVNGHCRSGSFNQMTQCSCLSVESSDIVDNPEDIFDLIQPRLDVQSDGLVRLDDNNIAEISFKGNWFPICGHWFWDNANGANLFCQKLGSQSGQLGDRTQLPREG